MERRQLMKAYGAELVLTEGAKGMKRCHCQGGGAGHVRSPAALSPVSLSMPPIPRRTSRPPARRSRRIPTARWTIFVAGVGTGGTITGVGQYLKSQKPGGEGGGRGACRVPPFSPPAMAGAHKIQGIGAGFVPQVLDTRVYDEIIPVENEDAFAAGQGDRPQRGRAGGHLLRRCRCGPPLQMAKRPGERGQDHRGAAAGYR